jgi:Ras-related protein Rab-1A
MEAAENVEKLKFKLCVLGDASVGKTSLIHHYCEGYFRESYLSTIGVAFLTKTINTTLDDGRKANIVLQIWDIGGQSIFQSIRSNYIKGAQGAYILFDVTNKNSLIHLDDWINELTKALDIKDLSKIPILIIGNKIDLDFDERLKVRALEYLRNQYSYEIPITYTSAKTGEGMLETFEQITKMMIKTVTGD